MMRVGLGLLLVLVLLGCEEEKKGRFAAQKQAPKVVEKVDVLENAITRDDLFERRMQDIRVRDNRNPFQEVKLIRGAASKGGGTPLESFEIAQLELVGIVWNITKPRALVRTPEGDEHNVTLNTKIGKNAGTVVAILSDKIIIEESFYDFRGELKQAVQELSLPDGDGGTR